MSNRRTDRFRTARGALLGLVMAGAMLGAMGIATVGPVGAAEWRRDPLAGSLQAAPLETVARHEAPPLDLRALQREDAERDEAGLPYRFARPERVDLDPARAGTWESPREGLDLWRLRVGSPGAISLNLGFTRYRLPEGAELAISAPGQDARVMVFGPQDNKPHGELWTPLLPGDEVVIELTIPTDKRDELELTLGSIGSGYRGFLDPDPEKGDWCEVDVVCPEGDDWREEIPAVGVYIVDGFWKCTGTLMDNTAQDGRPLFLTAYHCEVTEDNAASVVVYWNYESPSCGMQGGGSKDDYQTGASFVAAYSPTDFTLIELDDVPDPALGVTYVGWDATAAVPDSVVCIHHPQTQEKSISFDFDQTVVTSWAIESTPGNGTHLMVEDWDIGTTEGGSSGSALFNRSHRVVGQLHGGYAGCNNDEPDWYGRLHVSWTGGGTPETRLADHLDPLNSGLLVFPAIFPPALDALADWSPTGPQGGPFTPGSVTLTMVNRTGDEHTATLSLNVDWLDLSTDELTVAADGEADFTLTLNDLAGDLPTGTHEARLYAADVATGTERAYTATLRVGAAPRLSIQDATPNPFTSFVELHFTMGADGTYRTRIWDLRGRLIRDLGLNDGERGPNAVAWDGRNDGGARVAAGVYIGQIEAGGEEARIRILAIH